MPKYEAIISEYSSKKLDKSLQSEYPDIAKHWNVKLNGITAEYIAPKSTKFGWFTCDKCGSNFHKQVYIVTKHTNFKCGVCDGSIIIPGKNDLFTVRNDLMHLWDWVKNEKDNLDPHKLAPKTHKECNWKCSICGYTWSMSMPSIWKKKFCNNCGAKLGNK